MLVIVVDSFFLVGKTPKGENNPFFGRESGVCLDVGMFFSDMFLGSIFQGTLESTHRSNKKCNKKMYESQVPQGS